MSDDLVRQTAAQLLLDGQRTPMGYVKQQVVPVVQKVWRSLRPRTKCYAVLLVLAVLLIVFTIPRPHATQPPTLLNANLHAALDRKDAVTVERLLAQGADADAELPPGRTALMHAAKQGDAESALRLIWYGAKVNHKDPAGRTALAYARELKAQTVIVVLERARAKE